MVSLQWIETVNQINWKLPIVDHQQVAAIDFRGATTAFKRSNHAASRKAKNEIIQIVHTGF